jgi:hypothetical protein
MVEFQAGDDPLSVDGVAVLVLSSKHGMVANSSPGSVACGSIALIIVSAVLVWRMATGRTKRIARRISALSWRAKLDLAKRLVVDDRIPPPVRMIVPLLVLYLALPLDLIPDFIICQSWSLGSNRLARSTYQDRAQGEPGGNSAYPFAQKLQNASVSGKAR